MKKIIMGIVLVMVIMFGVSSVSADTWDCRSSWDHDSDMNGDGVLNFHDVNTLKWYLFSGLTSPVYDNPDINWDGSVDWNDYYNLYYNRVWGKEIYPGRQDNYRCWQAQYYDSIPLLNQYHTLQYIKYSEYTDENEYIPDEYVCHHFSIDLIESLRSKNVNAYYMWTPTTTGSHAEVMVFPYHPGSEEKPMIFDQSRTLQQYRRDYDEYAFNDVDSDGTVEYVEEVNYANPMFAYYYIIYGEWQSMQTNVAYNYWATDDGNILIDQNYC